MIEDLLEGDPQGTAAPPGVVLARCDTGAGPTVHTAGTRDLRDGAPMTADTAHDLASVSKLLTTVALLRLVDARDLTLDDTLGGVLGTAGPHADRTLAQLLEHRAGLVEWWPLYADPRTAEDPLGAVLRMPPRYAAGEARHYSDLGFQLLGAVVAAATGVAAEAAVHELVVTPLGLTATTPARPVAGPVAASSEGDTIERRMVATRTPYPLDVDVDAFTGWRTSTLSGEVNDGNAFHAFRGAPGHAGWFATVTDLLVLATALATDPDDHGLWRRETLARFLHAGADPGQALGFRRYAAGTLHPTRDLWGHTGFTGAAVAFAPATPTEPPYAVALGTNRLHGSPAPTLDRLPSVDTLLARALRATDPEVAA